jgi:hypothetical protein
MPDKLAVKAREKNSGKKEMQMKNVTADEVLRKTFKHLDQVLYEKNRQIEKGAEKSLSVALPSENFEHDAGEEKRGIENNRLSCCKKSGH